MNTRALLTRFLLTTVLCGLPLLAARAQGGAAESKLEGIFTYAPERSESIEKAIDNAVSQLNFVVRPIARGRLEKTNPAYKRLEINLKPGQVSIATNGRAAIKTPPSGSMVKWTREDGEVFDVSTNLSGDTLRQKFVAKDGQRTNEYTISADGQTLTMRVIVNSPRLNSPLTYRLVYRRS